MIFCVGIPYILPLKVPVNCPEYRCLTQELEMFQRIFVVAVEKAFVNSEIIEVETRVRSERAKSKRASDARLQAVPS